MSRDATLTERSVQSRLWICSRSSFDVLLPNYTPVEWWECDMFGVTRAGYFHEFEIKLTAADFRADAAKAKRRYDRADNWRPIDETKHVLLAGRSVRGPSMFWYVAPDGMIDLADVPEWAGLQVIRNGRWFETVKKAPRLHSQKIDRKIVEHALGVCYFRYWHARNEYDRATAKELSA